MNARSFVAVAGEPVVAGLGIAKTGGRHGLARSLVVRLLVATWPGVTFTVPEVPLPTAA